MLRCFQPFPFYSQRLSPFPTLPSPSSETLEQLPWARGRVGFSLCLLARGQRQTGSSAAAASDVIMMLVPLALPLRPRAFITLWGAAVTTVVWEVAPWGLLLGTWAGLLQAGQKSVGFCPAPEESWEEVEKLLGSGREHEHHLPQGLGERVGELAPPSTLFCGWPSLP